MNASQFKSPFLKTKRTLAIKEIYYITQVNSATRKCGVVISAGNYPSSSETGTKWLLNLLLNRGFGGLADIMVVMPRWLVPIKKYMM